MRHFEGFSNTVIMIYYGGIDTFFFFLHLAM